VLGPSVGILAWGKWFQYFAVPVLGPSVGTLAWGGWFLYFCLPCAWPFSGNSSTGWADPGEKGVIPPSRARPLGERLGLQISLSGNGKREPKTMGKGGALGPPLGERLGFQHCCDLITAGAKSIAWGAKSPAGSGHRACKRTPGGGLAPPLHRLLKARCIELLPHSRPSGA